MGFKSALGTVMGGLTALAVAAFSVVPGCQEMMKPNGPDETNTQQFFRGAVRGPVDAVKGGAEGLSGAFSAKDVERVLENADKAGRTIQQGVDQYQRNRGGGSSSAPSDIIGVPKPDYVPGVIPGDPAPPGK
ncbi:MAG: hypothetical protein KA099_03885 [Alphaproteobacteria bacterium]|nr:hypothetical protein [Alphaproteobacteria bacterium]MBP7759644.1 hypothetical protein [Alphaproteobacteria bacterium]MBP7762994.1 hypothetical protein [Alphaproteobacteria bacterium]MBP7904447.1 hypothetical protein [Alphaproteobacteria bacterium]